MSDHDALLRTICANPRDDLPRLVYADWLEENGRPDHAAFIRTDVEMARRPEWDADRVRHEAGLDGKAFFARHPWARAVFDGLPDGYGWTENPVVHRGFPWSLMVVYPNDLLRRRAVLFDRHPVTRLDFLLDPPRLDRLLAQPWAGRMTGFVFRRAYWAVADLRPLLASAELGGLEEIVFHSHSVRPAALPAVFESPLFANLTTFGIVDGGAQMGRAAVEGLAALPGPTRLRSLTLGVALPADGGLARLASSPVAAGLTHLNLRHNRLTASRLAPLTASGAFAGLRMLDLQGNQVGNAGTAALAAADLPHLAVLDLSYCMVGDDGARAILDSPLADRLVLLDLTGSPASDEMKQALKERMGERVRL